MLESTVDLLNGLFFIAMILLTAICIVGSIVAALHAVGGGSANSSSIQQKFVDNIKPVEGPLGHQMGSVDSVLNPVAPDTGRFGPGMRVNIYRGTEKRTVSG